MGPLPVLSRVITPLIGGFNPIYPFIRPFIYIYIGIITPFITSRGPPYRMGGDDHNLGGGFNHAFYVYPYLEE